MPWVQGSRVEFCLYGASMREGAWINAHTGAWRWITEHASWIQNSENAGSLGMPDTVHAELAVIPRDFNGPGRKQILRVAMDAGFIRVRGHGESVTFEFTLPTSVAIRAALPFMALNFGPLTGCVFNNLGTGSGFGGLYRPLLTDLAKGRSFHCNLPEEPTPNPFNLGSELEIGALIPGPKSFRSLVGVPTPPSPLPAMDPSSNGS